MRAPAERLTQYLGYRFFNPALLEQALTHRSAGAANNERLEFLGDALLGLVVAETLFHRHIEADEGHLSRLRARLVKQDTLAEMARTAGLGDYLNLGIGELRSGGYSRDSILADAMEALLGAVYLDGGITAATQLVLRLYGPKLQADTPEQSLKDPKTKLQELLQARGVSLPEYLVLDVWGNQHAQSFRVSCRIQEYSMVSQGTGGSRRRAEQQAAQLMLEQIMATDKSITS